MINLSIPTGQGGALGTVENLAQGITVQTYVSKKNEGFIMLHADSLSRLADHVKNTPCPKKEEWGDLHSRTNAPSKEWDFKAGWEGALEIAHFWPDGRDAIKTIAASMPGDFVAMPPVEWDTTGDRLDIPSYLAGDPEPWEIDDEAPGRGRFVRLIVPTGAPWFVSAKALQNRGAAIASVIDGLEAAGIRCEVEAVDSCSNGTGQTLICHRVKEAGAHLNLERLAASLAHPATFRRIGFAGLETLAAHEAGRHSPLQMNGGYGSAEEIRDPFKKLFPADSIFLPRLQGDKYDTPQGAREAVAAAFSEAGFTVNLENAP